MIKRLSVLFIGVTIVAVLFIDSVFNVEKINGVSLVSPPSKIEKSAFGTLKRVNASWVAVIPYAFSKQGEPQVTFDHHRQWWGERSQGTRALIKMAQNNNLQVMLKPHVWLTSGWVGEYNLKSEEDWKIWEEQYDKYIMNFASIAEELEVELLCIATEYKIASVNRPEYWKRLIAKIKKVYSGKLTYAANWDNYEYVTFWDDLDYIGIDAYFPLVEESQPENSKMAYAWDSIAINMRNMSNRYDKPVLFTEYGFQSVNGAAGSHWKVDKGESSLNMKLQADAYECLFKTVWQEPWMAGGFLWKWHFKEGAGGLQNPDWTPQGKPAEGMISKYYSN